MIRSTWAGLIGLVAFCVLADLWAVAATFTPQVVTGPLRPPISGEAGYSVAMSGDGLTAAVGVPLANFFMSSWMSGAAIYTYASGSWSLQTNSLLVASDATSIDNALGYTVALSGDGNVLAVGGPVDNTTFNDPLGAIWIFTRTGITWVQDGPKLVVGSITTFKLGETLAMSADGQTIASSTSVDGVCVFAYVGGAWTIQAESLLGSSATSSVTAIALSSDGNTLFSAASGDNAVWVFNRDSSSDWNQFGDKLTVSGSNMFGLALASSGDGTIIAVSDNPTSGNNHVYMFALSGGQYTLLQTVTGTDNGVNGFGISLALDQNGHRLLVGDANYSSGLGGFYRFDFIQETWMQIGGIIVGSGSNVNSVPKQGHALSIDSSGAHIILSGPSDYYYEGSVWFFNASALVPSAAPTHMPTSVSPTVQPSASPTLQQGDAQKIQSGLMRLLAVAIVSLVVL